ncbi:MAG: alanine racemase [Candidatus Hodarchaeales archaeon]|jgi:D-serine deaminase-like pyridoxal phosphate-dependent protein
MKITKPTLLINEEQVRQNIRKFVTKTRQNNIRFRPHFKTHQSETIGNWFKEYEVSSITVSSLDMAKYFVNAGWQDITIAFPVNIRQLDEINKLANRCKLGLLVDSVDSASILAEKVTNSLSVWIEIDQGYHRTGVHDDDTLVGISEILNDGARLEFSGLLTHAGHAYSAQSVEELQKIHIDSISDLMNKQTILNSQGFEGCQLSIGDTPTCSVSEDFTGIDEIRPGSFVFYDLDQLSLGACIESELAMGVACPVVAIYPERNQIIIYGGAVHLSKEYQITPTGDKSFGRVGLLTQEGWTSSLPDTYVSSISQEHGIIQTNQSVLEKIKLGDLLFILPVHSCLTANLFSNYQTISSEKINKMQSLSLHKKN